jgi:hypothetical protein
MPRTPEEWPQSGIFLVKTLAAQSPQGAETFDRRHGLPRGPSPSPPRRKEVMVMKSFRFLLSLAAAGMLAVSTPGAWSQPSQDDANQQAASVSPACQLVNEALNVQLALNRFDTALASHDVQQLLAIGVEPSSAKGWQRFFRDNPRATVTDTCSGSDLSISGDTANWSCKETSTIVSEGKPVQYAHNIRFTFTRKNGEWTLADRR